MKVVLGIDAAWTKGNPSGVAVVVKTDNGWLCRGVAPSYQAFIDLAGGTPVDWAARPTGSVPDIPALLKAAEKLAGGPVDVVAIDMPISNEQITGRRKADDEISRAFGTKWAATHTPSVDNPGEIGSELSKAFKEQGYEIITSKTQKLGAKPLIEVYPHPALISLLNSSYRIPYKKKAGITVQAQRDKFRIIKAALDMIIANGLPDPDQIAVGVKHYEDALDALVCAWGGICFIEGYAEPHGDESAAIWVPDKLTHLTTQIARQPSFTTFEGRLDKLIRQYCSQISDLEVIPVPANNYIIRWPGKNPDARPIALTAHLDKINHSDGPHADELPVIIEGDELVGQLDDAAGVAICIHLLAECQHIRNCPPIMVLLSEMEEISGYENAALLKKGGLGVDLSPGAHRIADYLLNHEVIPQLVITVDTSAALGRTGGVLLYTDFWEFEGTSSQDQPQELLEKTRKLRDKILKNPMVTLTNGRNDYVTYGSRFNTQKGHIVPSIAIEPAIFPLHGKNERIKRDDLAEASSIILEQIRQQAMVGQQKKPLAYDHHDKAGNQGDVIKHVALLAAADALMCGKTGSFSYADTFAGYPFNPIRAGGEWLQGIGRQELRNLKTENTAITFWKELWHCQYGLPGSTYPGSSTFIRKLCMKNEVVQRLALWDTMPAVVSQLKQAFCTQEASIYSHAATPDEIASFKPDLLLIDPPDLALVERLLQFFDVAENVIMWLPLLYKQGVETKETRDACRACEDKGLVSLTATWGGESAMQGCRLFYALPEDVIASVKKAVREIGGAVGWKVRCQ